MKVSIVIRCYNEQEHIGRLLEGIQQQTLSELETVIVDSGSTDATLDIARRFPVRIVSIRPEEFSFGRSLNHGITAATGDAVVFASAHVYPVYTDWIERLVEPLRDPEVALTYGKQRGNSITKYAEHRVFAKWFPERSNLSQEHFFCNNANAAIRRELWKGLPYDEELTGLEDLDWAKRVMALGHRIAYVAEAEIIHVHDETLRQVYNRYLREAIALKRISPEEHFHFGDFLKFFIGNVASDWHHAWHDRVLLRNLLDIPMFRLMQFWGTFRGFSRHGKVGSALRRRFYYPNGRRSHLGRNAEGGREADPVVYPPAASSVRGPAL